MVNPKTSNVNQTSKEETTDPVTLPLGYVTVCEIQPTFLTRSREGDLHHVTVQLHFTKNIGFSDVKTRQSDFYPPYVANLYAMTYFRVRHYYK